MKRHKAAGLSGLVAEMIQPTGDIGTQWILERVFCRCIYFHLNLKKYFMACYGGNRPPYGPATDLNKCGITYGKETRTLQY